MKGRAEKTATNKETRWNNQSKHTAYTEREGLTWGRCVGGMMCVCVPPTAVSNECDIEVCPDSGEPNRICDRRREESMIEYDRNHTVLACADDDEAGEECIAMYVECVEPLDRLFDRVYPRHAHLLVDVPSNRTHQRASAYE